MKTKETVRHERNHQPVPSSRELTQEQLKAAIGGSGAVKPGRPL